MLTYFLISVNMCAMEFAEKLTLIHFFALSLLDHKMTDHTFKILAVAKVKSLPWKHMACNDEV